MTSRSLRISLFLRVLLMVALTASRAIAIDDKAEGTRFIIAGHAYGTHRGENIALHPPFLV